MTVSGYRQKNSTVRDPLCHLQYGSLYVNRRLPIIDLNFEFIDYNQLPIKELLRVTLNHFSCCWHSKNFFQCIWHKFFFLSLSVSIYIALNLQRFIAIWIVTYFCLTAISCHAHTTITANLNLFLFSTTTRCAKCNKFFYLHVNHKVTIMASTDKRRNNKLTLELEWTERINPANNLANPNSCQKWFIQPSAKV